MGNVSIAGVILTDAIRSDVEHLIVELSKIDFDYTLNISDMRDGRYKVIFTPNYINPNYPQFSKEKVTITVSQKTLGEILINLKLAEQNKENKND